MNKKFNNIKRIFIYLFLTSNLKMLSAETWNWSENINTSPNAILGMDDIWKDELHVGADGMNYTIGTFRGEMVLNDIDFHSTGNSYDIYIIKYNEEGNILWARTISSTSHSVAASVTTDDMGNVYISGSVKGIVNFGNINKTKNVGQNEAGFITKFNKNGDEVWTFVLNNNGTNWIIRDLSVDLYGNVFYTGARYGSVSKILNKTIYGDTFVSKLNINGKLNWYDDIVTGEYSVASDTGGRSIEVDNFGNCILTGIHKGSTNFQGTYIKSTGGLDTFVAKYNSCGSLLWVKNLGGEFRDIVNSISLDEQSDCYITGMYEKIMFFNKNTKNELVLNSDSLDIFIAKIDGQNGETIWVKGASTPDISGGLNRSYDVEVSKNGSVFIFGEIREYAKFDNIIINTENIPRGFIAEFTKSGDTKQVIITGIGTSFSHGYGFGINKKDSISIKAVLYGGDLDDILLGNLILDPGLNIINFTP